MTRIILVAVLIAPACTSMWAQNAPQPLPFDGSRYTLVLPNRPVAPRVILRPNAPVTARVMPNRRPCAVARIVQPKPGIDPQIVSATPKLADAHPEDLAETNVPAPSCSDR